MILYYVWQREIDQSTREEDVFVHRTHTADLEKRSLLNLRTSRARSHRAQKHISDTKHPFINEQLKPEICITDKKRQTQEIFSID